MKRLKYWTILLKKLNFILKFKDHPGNEAAIKWDIRLVFMPIPGSFGNKNWEQNTLKTIQK